MEMRERSGQRGLGGQLLGVIFSPGLCRAGSCYSFLSPCKLLSVKQGWGWGHPLISHTHFVTDYCKFLSSCIQVV